MSGPVPLSSMAEARRMMRRHRASNTIPWCLEGSQGSGSTPPVSAVAAGNPAWRSAVLPPCFVTQGSPGDLAPSGGVEFLGGLSFLLPH